MQKTNLLVPGLTGAIALACCIATAETLNESFADDPFMRGWRVYGNTNLFVWNPTNQNLEVTWDSSKPNSYFYRCLDTILTLADEFALQFDLRLDSLEAGGWGFQIALGFINLQNATDPNFLRGTGMDSPNLFEFDYFPDVGFGASITATMTDSNSRFAFWYVPKGLETGVTYRIWLYHAPGVTNIDAVVLLNGEVYANLSSAWISPGFGDFRLNAIAVSSYNDTASGGSILARGVVDNLLIVTPPPPVTGLVSGFAEGNWTMQFQSQTNWVYVLERTQDFVTWIDVSPNVIGTGSILSLQDNSPPVDRAFYRVRAYRP